HPGMTEDDIYSYAEILRRSYNLESRILRKLIRNECDRAKPTRLYDLDYDLQLKEALNIIEHENFYSLISKAKTLKQLEDERKAKEAQTASSEPAKK
ncbi:MAG: peptidase S41, partial [Treponema sp.]|nr:peptidase S41 [Treponema sp.]